jgi:hypothetical protein
MDKPVVISRDLPLEVSRIHVAWRRLWQWSSRFHYIAGGLSVFSSAMAAMGGEWAPYFATAAAVLTALIGFVHPERQYLKFVRAWRLLDIAAMRYSLGLIGVEELVYSAERGEKLIADVEGALDKPGAQRQPAKVTASG